PDRTREVRNVVARVVRLDRERLDLELSLGQIQSRQLGLVEALVVEVADVADQRRLERRTRPRATSGREQGREHCRRHQHGKHACRKSLRTQENPPPALSTAHPGRAKTISPPTPSEV